MKSVLTAGHKFSIRGDFLGLSGDDELETETLEVAAELKKQARVKEWNHRVKFEAINRYHATGNGVELIVLPNVIQYQNVVSGDVEGILRKHLTDTEVPVEKGTPEPVR